MVSSRQYHIQDLLISIRPRRYNFTTVTIIVSAFEIVYYALNLFKICLFIRIKKKICLCFELI